MVDDLKNIKFKKNSLIDNILIELIKTHYELRDLKDSIDNDTMAIVGSERQKDYIYRKRVTKKHLKDKLYYLSNLLMGDEKIY